MYYKMDTLRIAVIGDDLFMYIIGQLPKHGSVKDNPIQMEMITSFDSITKEEFENNIPSDTLNYCLFKALYYKTIEAKAERVNNLSYGLTNIAFTNN